MIRLLCLVLLLLAPLEAYAAAALTKNSFVADSQTTDGREAYTAQLVKCALTSPPTTESPEDGEECESGDWTQQVDARGFSALTIRFVEVGGGSAVAKLWNCQPTTDGSGFRPDAQSPDTSASLTVTLLCDEVTDGITLDGTTTTTFVPNMDTLGPLGILVGEIETCTGNCDSIFAIQLSH